ncbi:MAG: class I SAM-dependent methyltransferase [Candidatus Xenobia bacterium]
MPVTRVQTVARHAASYLLVAGLRFPALFESGLSRLLFRIAFSLLAPRYDETYRSLGVLGNPRWEVARDLLPEQPCEILDLSTGTGDAALQMATLFPQARITGVDFAAPTLRLARRKAEDAGVAERVRFVDGDAAMLPFPDASFDLVLTQNAPCHVEEMVRVCRSQGVVAAGWALLMYRTVDRVAHGRWKVAGLRNIVTRPCGLGMIVAGTVP